MEPIIYTSQDHHIRNDHIDPNALFVLKRLHEAGFTAYLVGGGVRDLLLHKKPKDFDISTNAKPEEIKALFRSCILIGRRFRLAHVRFGKDFIEVATFRAGDTQQEEFITEDNVWGTPEQDVLRRDFTINGLFYDPLDHRIIDYVGGFEDLKKHLLRVIGDPFIRFKQDPVRMIRMQKFRARFGFHMDEKAEHALIACYEEIKKSSPARILEEMFRMLESGASATFFELLYESHLLRLLFPALHDQFESDKDLILSSLKVADSMNTRGHYKPLDRSIMVAAIVYPILEKQLATLDHPHIGEVMEISAALIQTLFTDAFVHFPRRVRFDAHFILQMQYRLTPNDRRKRPSTRLLRQRNFPIALTFLKLRALMHPALFKTYEHWKRLWNERQEANDPV